MPYVDGFVVPIPKRNVPAYRRIARKAARVWRDHGALEYVECVGDDFAAKWAIPFTRLARTKRGETVVLAWIVYRSRAHRDRVNRKVMKDPRMAAMMEGGAMPFEVRRMAFSGFRVLVSA